MGFEAESEEFLYVVEWVFDYEGYFLSTGIGIKEPEAAIVVYIERSCREDGLDGLFSLGCGEGYDYFLINVIVC